MNADHELVKDFVSRVKPVAPDRPQIAVPTPTMVSGQTAPPRPTMATGEAPERPSLATPVPPSRPPVSVPERTMPGSPPAMPTFQAKERAAYGQQASEMPSKRDASGDMLREIRDLLKGQQGDGEQRQRFNPANPKAPTRAPSSFGHLLRQQ